MNDIKKQLNNTAKKIKEIGKILEKNNNVIINEKNQKKIMKIIRRK